MTVHPTYYKAKQSLETVVRKYNPFAPIIAEHEMERLEHRRKHYSPQQNDRKIDLGETSLYMATYGDHISADAYSQTFEVRE